MKWFKTIVVAGWVGWVSTTKWDDVSSWPSDEPVVSVSTMTQRTPRSDYLPQQQKIDVKERPRDILLGPRAPSWRDVRTDGLREDSL